MSAPHPPDTELQRELWRHEYGYTSARRIREVLRTEYQRALHDFASVAAALPAVRRHDPALLASHDAFRARAAAEVNRGRWREALECLLHGRRLMERLRDLAGASARLDRAAAAAARLHDLARTPGLRVLPCITAPSRLLERAREQMAAGRYGQARYLADAALAEAAPVDRHAPAEPAAADALAARLRELRALCESTRGYAGAADADPLADGSLDAALALARNGYAALAERMADELAFALTPRVGLHRELRRAQSASDETAAVLRGAANAAPADADVCGSLTAALWRTRVEAGLHRAIDQCRRLELAGARAGTAARPSVDRSSTGNPSGTRNPA